MTTISNGEDGDDVRVKLNRLVGAIYNVKDYGAVGDGSTDDTAEIQAAIDAAIAANGGIVYFPVNSSSSTYYKTSAPLTIAGVTSKQVWLVGEKGIGGYGSKIIGNFSGYLIDHTNSDEQMLAGVSGLVLQNPHATGGGIRVENSQQCIIEHVYMQAAYRGVYAASNAYNTHIRNSVIGGLNNAAGSIGIMAGQVIVSECSIVGWDEGVRAFNAGFCLENSRVEVNLVGVRLGVDGAGAGSTLGGSSIKANSFERNDTGILIEGVGGCAIIGNFITGTESVAGGGDECDYGIRSTGGCQGTLVSGNTISGTFEEAGIAIEGLYSEGSEVWSANVVANPSLQGGVPWIVTNPHGKTFIANPQLDDVSVVTGDIGLYTGYHKNIHINTGSNNTVYIRVDSEFNGYGGIPPIGWVYTFRQLGSGTTTFVADTGTIRFPASKNKITGQYSTAYLTKIATDTWVLSGDIKT